MWQSVDLVNSNEDKLYALIFLTAVWTVIFLIVNATCKFTSLSPKKAHDTRNRIVSIIHGLVSFVLAAHLYIQAPSFSLPNTQLQSLTCLISLSYCIYDLIACLYYGLSDAALVIHHVCCFGGFGVAVWQGYGCVAGIGGLLVAQVSNLPMHLRVILRNYNLKNTKAYQLAQNIYLGLYIVFRGLLCPIIVFYPTAMSTTTPLVVKIVCGMILAQSYYFINQMRGIIKKKIQKSKELKEKGIQYMWLEEDESKLSQLSFYKKAESQKIF